MSSIGKNSELVSLFKKIRCVKTDLEYSLLLADLFRGSNKIIVLSFLNAYAINIAEKNKEFERALRKSDFLLRDGVGASILMQSIGVDSGNNMNGTDFIPKVIELATRQHVDIVLFGTAIEVVRKARERLESSGTNVIEVESGFKSFHRYLELLEGSINRKSMVILGMGMPKQEELSLFLKESLVSPHDVLIVNGGAILDFLGGNATRAPHLFQKMRLEWLFRFFSEPRRLFGRCIVGGLVFFKRLVSLKFNAR